MMGPNKKSLERLAQDNPHINFLGECTPAQLRSLYCHAAALVIPSIWHETFGNVAIEAMRQRLPIIVQAFHECARQTTGKELTLHTKER
jgi:glycosyltransferase involved in cell wall biosynthesis